MESVPFLVQGLGIFHQLEVVPVRYAQQVFCALFRSLVLLRGCFRHVKFRKFCLEIKLIAVMYSALVVLLKVAYQASRH